MKISKLMVFCVCFVVAIFTSFNIHGQSNTDSTFSTDKLEDEFLGLHLGCSMKELKELLRKSPNSIKLSKKDVLEGMQAYLYTGNHRLNGATATVFAFWEGKLGCVTVFFETEEAEKIYDALKMKMEERYAKMGDEIKFAGKKCSLTKGGMVFSLRLDREPFGRDKVMLSAMHMGIMKEMRSKEIKKKAQDLGKF